MSAEAFDSKSFWHTLGRQKAFLLVTAILLCAAGGLTAAVERMQLTFRKLPVELAAPLKTLKPELGPWVQASVDRAMSPDFEHELGASEYLFRDYIDTRLVSPADRLALLKATPDVREKLRANLKDVDSRAFIRFAVTYYTGSVDTVPHVPDRCYAADGFKPSAYDVVTWPVLPRAEKADRETGVRLINFVDQVDSRHSRPRQVAYFFQVNGAYEQDPLGVRARLQNLFDRRAYFAKIELVTDLPDPATAAEVMTDFLTTAMPDTERVLPDWKKVNH